MVEQWSAGRVLVHRRRAGRSRRGGEIAALPVGSGRVDADEIEHVRDPVVVEASLAPDWLKTAV